MGSIISITFASGKYRLNGNLHLPDNEKPPVVIGSHGMLSSGSSPKQIALAKKCNEYGIAFFRFDHQGCGDSEGEITSLSGRCQDMIIAAEMILSRNDLSPRLGLFGSSFGGSTCLSVAKSLKAEVVVTIAAPIRIRTSEEAAQVIGKTNDPRVDDLIRLKVLTPFDTTDKVREISNILIFHGDEDALVPSFHAIEIHREAGMPKRLIMLKSGDHTISNPEHQQIFLHEASLWFKAILCRANPM